MKKVLALILVLVLVLSLVACGARDKNDTANYIGTWETNDSRLIINKGGVCEIKSINGVSSISFNWEIKNEVIVFSMDDGWGGTTSTAFELNETGTSLVAIQSVLMPFSITDTEFIKK